MSDRSATRWYDRVAPLYDWSTFGDSVYAPMRRRAVRALDPREGDGVLALFVGTGADLPHLAEALGGSGRIVAVDGSEAMLRRARTRLDPDAWPRLSLDIEQADLAGPDGRTWLSKRIAELAPSGVLMTLGLSVLADWRALFDTAFDAAPAGCRFAIMDDRAVRTGPSKWLVDWIGDADTGRPVWQGLEARARDFTYDDAPLWPGSGVRVFVAAGRKP